MARTLSRRLCEDPSSHSPQVCVPTTTGKSLQPKENSGALLSLDIAIGPVNIGKDASSTTPAPAVFGIATTLLAAIRIEFLHFCNENREVYTQPR